MDCRAARFGLLVSAIATLVLLTYQAFRHPYLSWDLEASAFIQSLSVTGFEQLMVLVSAPGNGWNAWVLVLVLGALLIQMELKTEAAFFMAGIAAGGTLNDLFKWIVDRPRPSHELVKVLSEFGDCSFPSGHVSFYVELFGFLLLLGLCHTVNRTRGRLLFAAAMAPILLVGPSRIYLGAHWLSDTLGGYLVGGLWLWGMWASYLHVRARIENP